MGGSVGGCEEVGGKGAEEVGHLRGGEFGLEEGQWGAGDEGVGVC